MKKKKNGLDTWWIPTVVLIATKFGFNLIDGFHHNGFIVDGS